MRNMRKKYSGFLFDMAIPLIFFEWWNVLLAFIFIVLLETFIVKFYIKENYNKLFLILFKANLITTLAGYLVQGVLRMVSLMLIFKITNQFFESYPILSGILENVAIDKKFNPITGKEITNGVKFQWGIESVEDIELLDQRIKLVEYWRLSDLFKSRQNIIMRILAKITSVGKNANRIMHVKFVE
jgi:hypothetical protein